MSSYIPESKLGLQGVYMLVHCRLVNEMPFFALRRFLFRVTTPLFALSRLLFCVITPFVRRYYPFSRYFAFSFALLRLDSCIFASWFALLRLFCVITPLFCKTTPLLSIITRFSNAFNSALLRFSSHNYALFCVIPTLQYIVFSVILLSFHSYERITLEKIIYFKVVFTRNKA